MQELNKSFCSACGSETRYHSILICAECLDDDCNKFSSLFEDQEDDNPEQTNIIELNQEKND